MRLQAHVISEWDACAAGHWDSAVKGSSALRAQLMRSLEVELCDSEQKNIVHFLWDMRKFYDSIRLCKLVPELTRLGYPAHTLTLGLIVHKAPRLLLVGDWVSDPITGTCRSIVAGCQQSVSWARDLLHKLVETLGYIMPGSICFEHVDDFSQAVASHSSMRLYNAC